MSDDQAQGRSDIGAPAGRQAHAKETVRARTRTGSRRRILAVCLCAVVAVAMAVVPGAAARATTGDVGLAGQSTVGAGAAPTGQKPESKLWWNDGRWWASMF